MARRVVRNLFNIGTWNIRSTNYIGSWSSLAMECEKWKLDVIAVQETLSSITTPFTARNFRFFNVPAKDGRGGVAMGVHRKWWNAVVGWRLISNRLMWLKFNSIRGPLTFLNAYAPQQAESTEVKDNFYCELAEVYDTVASNSLVMLGDYNAHVGCDTNKWPNVVGRFNLPGINSNGERLLTFCQSRSLRVLNTYFQHKLAKKITWQNAVYKSAIDFIISSSTLQSGFTNVVVKSTAAFNTDHHLVLGNLKIPMPIRPRNNGCQRLDETKMNNYEVKRELTVDVNVSYPSRNESLRTPNAEWSTLEQSAKRWQRVMMGKIGRKSWISDFTMALIERKRMAKLLLLQNSTRPNWNHWKALQRLTQFHLRCDRNNWLAGRLTTFNSAWKRKDWRCAFGVINGISGTRKNIIHGSVKSASGVQLFELNDQLERWAEYFSDFFEAESLDDEDMVMAKKSDSLVNANNGAVLPRANWNMMEMQLRRMKGMKAPGPNGVFIDVFKTIRASIKWMKRVFDSVIHHGRTPHSWSKGILVPLYKKGAKDECRNYRPITLLDSSRKWFTRVLLATEQAFWNDLPVTQAGFRKGYSTADHIFTLADLAIKHQNFDIPLYCAFVDLNKAFDSVKHEKIWETLTRRNCNPMILKLLKSLYQDINVQVRVNGHLSRMVKVKRGVQQGCPLSPILFNFVLQDVLNQFEIHADQLPGMVSVLGSRLSHLEYADDIVVISNSAASLQLALIRLSLELDEVGLTINKEKSVLVRFGKKGIADQKPPILIDGGELKWDKEVKYLGIRLDEELNWAVSVKHRISGAQIAFSKYRQLWKAKNVSNNFKIQFYLRTVRPALIYSLHLLPLRLSDRRKLDVADNRFVRNILKIHWDDFISTKQIHGKYQFISVSSLLKKFRLSWFGHLTRMNVCRWAKRMVYWYPKVKRKRGRPRVTWLDVVREDLISMNLQLQEVERKVKDRKEWKKLCDSVIE